MQRLRFIAITALALVAPHTVRAQEREAPSAEHKVTPPKLVQSIQPEYPAARLQSAESASVALVLTLDATGHVIDVSVASSAGEDFDASAIAAAKRLVFEPATRDGAAVAAKIPFRFQFEAPAPAAPEPAPAAPPPPSAPAPAQAATKAPEVPETEALDIEVEGQRPPREPTQRTISGEEITKIPGTNGDALRSIQNMPGVARVGAFDGALIVRGSSPRDTRVFADGTGMPFIYHFGGLSSVIPSEMLERIDFYPGNFGPQYGRGTGGMVDVGVRSPRKDKLGGLVQFDLIDGRVLAEGPIDKSTRFMIGGRRSWLDAWLGSVLDSPQVGVTAAPVYYDYQAMLERDLTKDTTARLFFFGSDDRLKLTLKSPDAGDPAFSGDFGTHERFWRLQGRIDTRPTSGVRWTTTLTVANTTGKDNIGALALDFSDISLAARSDVRAKMTSYMTAVAGVDVEYDKFDVSYRVPAGMFEDNQSSGPIFGKPIPTLRGKADLVQPAGYAMLELTPTRGLKLLPGVRADYDNGTKKWTLGPRMSARWDIHQDYPRTTLKGGAGLYHQPPEAYESIKPFGNSGLRPESATHYSLGFEQELARPIEVSLEGFYKDLKDIVIATPDASGSANGSINKNVGSGRVYGSELLLRYKPDGRFFGWVAYTLSKSERKDSDDAAYYTYDYDQTHVLTALGSYKLGRGWQLGARFRYVTGRPYTPEIGGTMDYDAGTYAPVSSTARNSERIPAFHQLDVRVDKTWKFQAWSLNAYLDVQNVYNHRSNESVDYNFDYSQQTAVRGLPLLPIVGLKGEL
jgi:TonB family protein